MTLGLVLVDAPGPFARAGVQLAQGVNKRLSQDLKSFPASWAAVSKFSEQHDASGSKC